MQNVEKNADQKIRGNSVSKHKKGKGKERKMDSL